MHKYIAQNQTDWHTSKVTHTDELARDKSGREAHINDVKCWQISKKVAGGGGGG
jgi:hypothetical protein